MVHRAYFLLFFAAFTGTLIFPVFAATKLEEIPAPGGLNVASSIFSRCLAPLSSLILGKSEMQPICSANEFSGYSGEEMMKLDGKEIKSLPASYFASLKIAQAAPLSPTFIGHLNKDQAMAFPKTAEEALSDKSRKILQKIKRKPGPTARAAIMALSALTAFLVFKYS
mgnify:CR=1 FL=1